MKKCSTIIFSRNRPLQLDLCLKTLLNHCQDILEISDVTVLYRNDEDYRKSFDNLMSEFPQISFKKEENFKKDLLSLLSHKSNISFTFFVVDDQVFTTDFLMKDVISTLVENHDCLGFSLRLGKNCVTCFPYNCKQNVPEFYDVRNNIKKFNWQKAEYDFNYPIELSASVFRLKDIIEILESCEYYSPNSLESCMSMACIEDKPDLLCYDTSRSFSFPMNKVQSSHPNRSENFDPDTLRLLYEKGSRFDIKQFDEYMNIGAHDTPKIINIINKEIQ